MKANSIISTDFHHHTIRKQGKEASDRPSFPDLAPTQNKGNFIIS
jgi:hypothetical protein